MGGGMGGQGQGGGYGGGLAGIVDPLMYASLMQQQSINYNPYLQASQQAGQQYGNLARQSGLAGNVMIGQAANNFGQQQQMQGMGNQLWNQAADPQHALYNQMQQQVQDQTGAVNSMYGLGASGAGAGIAQQALGQFDMNWQNQQLQRMLQGAQGYEGLSRAGGQMGTLGAANLQAGMGYYGQQPGYTQQSAGVPLQAQQMVAGMPAQNANQYVQGISSAMTPYNQQMNQTIPYMNYGAGAQNNAFTQNLKQDKQQNEFLNQIGTAAGQIDWSKLGGMFNRQGQGLYSSYDYQNGSDIGFPLG
jgi:hypothetical protein